MNTTASSISRIVPSPNVAEARSAFVDRIKQRLPTCLALGLLNLLLAGCSSPIATGVRILDDSGAPLAGAIVQLTYAVPHTVVTPRSSGPTDINGFVSVPRHKVNATSHAMVTTPTEVVTFNASQFGALREGVLTLSTWRGMKDRTQEVGFDGDLHVPSVFLQKDRR